MAKKPGSLGSMISKDRQKRVLGRLEQGGSLSPAVKTALFFAVVFVLAALLAWLDPRPSLRHVKVGVLSGSPTGHYHAIVETFAAEVSRRKGRLTNVPTAGSAENIQRLIAARKTCDVHFALVQGGMAYPEGHGLELIGHLPNPESLFILGRNPDRFRVPADLKGVRLGIGPVGSGTEQLMRRVLVELAGLDVVVSTQPIDEQLEMLERGELDLGAIVISEDAKLLADAVVRRNLDILAMPNSDSLARRLHFARTGTIEAGQLDYVRQLPRVNKTVLKIDTLIVGNGCAPNGVTQGMMAAAAELMPTFVKHNKGTPNLTGLPMASVAQNFFKDEGADLLGTYAPWAVDIMPLPTWLQIGVAVSVLFSVMGMGHRFRLWRIDADRVKLESEIPELFGSGTTVGAIAEMPADPRHATPEVRARLDEMMARLSSLADRCRKHSLSVLVPMGEEMSYRYQETLISDLVTALRLYRDRLPTGA
jgi:TRAP-type uncharacterized transport system substrate-binding protein